MDIFKLFGTIAIKGSEEANDKIDNVTQKAESSGSKIGSVLTSIGGAVVKIGAFVATGVAAVATGIGAMSASAIRGYADYEQLVGGVETLFGTGGQTIAEYAQSVGKSIGEVSEEFWKLREAEETVLQNANNAFKTAGLSANEYMETVTSFSASLIASLDGDTAKAAQLADQAIIDMSDNANKMGTDMTAIQNAYQGFAKQNYTMLDNLKLGYGGTQEEMQRLLEDAEKLSGIKYDISSFSDVTEAIHVIQTEMGITGTTANEAATTIQGSIGMMKSAWQNFITGMADPDQDFDSLVNNLIESVVAFSDNLIPRIQATLPRLVHGLSQIIQNLVPYIPGILSALIPALISGATTLITELMNNLPAILEEILPGFGGDLGDSIISVLSDLVEMFDQIIPPIMDLVQSLLPLIPPIINQLLPPIINITQMLITSLLPVIQTIIDDVLPVAIDLFNSIIPYMQDIMQKLLPVIVDLVQQLLPPLMDIIEKLLPVLTPILDLIFVLLEPILAMLDPLISLTLEIIELLEPLIDLLVVLLEPFMDLLEIILPPLIEIISAFIAVLAEDLTICIEALAIWINETLIPAFIRIKDTVVEIKDKVVEKFEQLKAKVIEKITYLKDKITGTWENIKEGLGNIVDGIKQKFSDGFNALVDIVKTPLNSIIGFVNHVIDALNSIQIDIPDWVPEWGGKTFGINIPNLSYLAKGGIITDPTLLGYNPISGRGVVAGEAGDEAIAPIAVLQKYIAESVVEATANHNSGLVAVLEKILEAILAMDDNMGGNMREALAGTAFSINNREFARLVKAVN